MAKADPSRQRRKLVILCGPSGVGKATLKNKVIELAQSERGLPSYVLMPLLYSRQPRKGETDGEFRFVAKEEIAELRPGEVFRRSLYGKYWQAVRVKDLEAAFGGEGISILELPRLLAFDVMSRYCGVRSILLSPVPVAKALSAACMRDAELQLESRQRERANAKGDWLSEDELRLRIKEGIELLSVADRFNRVRVMPSAPVGRERDAVVAEVARQFIDFVQGEGELSGTDSQE